MSSSTANGDGNSSHGSESNEPTPTKKLPYIRSKRPKGYKASLAKETTATISLVTNPVHAYDAALSEAKDFLQAASEAQNLGRLNMSSSYLALSHIRLVALAKRFDLAAPSSSKQHHAGVLDDQLKALLPPDVQWDHDMMSHLASAAAEYHAKRSRGGADVNSVQEAGVALLSTPTPSTPNTLATVPQANCDVRSVLRGDPLMRTPVKNAEGGSSKDQKKHEEEATDNAN